ncbi:MAG: hypothetical protein KAS88_02300 [Deltaproteobacteria bacterium]|nr:hypothetical protein [Deltaproteobacteria bacterium]
MDIKDAITILASIGFICSIITFIGGFRMVRKTDHHGEPQMHKMNGYITVIVYVMLATLAVSLHFKVLLILAWFIGFCVHLFKLFLVKKGLAVRYGGYMGGMLLIVWLVVIFTHLPK